MENTRIEIKYSLTREGYAQKLQKNSDSLRFSNDADQTNTAEVFTTTICSITNKTIRIKALDRHIDRLFQHHLNYFHSCPHNKKEIIDLLNTELNDFYNNHTYNQIKVRIRATPQYIIFNFENYVNPWRSKIISLKSIELEGPAAIIKNNRMLKNKQCRENALKAGYDEALLIVGGKVTECAWANFFWFTDSGKLFTTDNNMLEGISRSLIIDNFDCEFENPGIDKLKSVAVEAFVTQSTSGITPVDRIDDKNLQYNKHLKQIKDHYEKL